MNRTRLLGALVLAAVFLLGAVGGAGVTYAHLRAGEPVGPPSPEARLRGLTHRLDLRPEQRDQIAAIFARNEPELQALMGRMDQQCGQQVRDRIDAIDAEIRAVLDAEQQSKFDALREERKRRGLMGHGPRGGPGPHGGPGHGWRGGRGPGPGPGRLPPSPSAAP